LTKAKLLGKNRNPLAYALVALGLVLFVATLAFANEFVPGLINARVVSIYDGDTFTVDATPWPGVTIRVSVRVDGVDTPEIRGKCQVEKDMAIEAREFVKETIGENVHLVNVRHGKYAGRVVAKVLVNGQDLAALIIGAGLGRPYQGGAREGWCGAESPNPRRAHTRFSARHPITSLPLWGKHESPGFIVVDSCSRQCH